MYDAMIIAHYIIDKCTREGCPVSNLQLQKILYYIQRSFLKVGLIAFPEEIEAWQFGPVVRVVYNNYCGFGAAKIRMLYDISLRREIQRMMDPIIREKRVLNPWDLVDDTHRPEKAWAEIYRDGIGNHQIIPKELILEKG